jgi:hypothetical protein
MLRGRYSIIFAIVQQDPWREYWNALNLELHTLATLGLELTSSDRVVWQACQEREFVLVTGNRNDEGPDSLEATVRDLNRPECLPVFTIANVKRAARSHLYAEQIALKFLDYLRNIEQVRGTGRLYLP